MKTATSTAIALLLLRLVVGAILIAHGAQKFLDTTIPGVQGFFEGLGIPAAAVAAPLVASIEVVAGLLLVVGFATRIAAALGAAVSLGALFTVHLSAGFFAGDGGFEFVLLLAAAAGALALTGAGLYSLDALRGSTRRSVATVATVG